MNVSKRTVNCFLHTLCLTSSLFTPAILYARKHTLDITVEFNVASYNVVLVHNTILSYYKVKHHRKCLLLGQFVLKVKKFLSMEQHHLPNVKVITEQWCYKAGRM